MIHPILRILVPGFVAMAAVVLGSCDSDRSAGNNGTSTDNVVMARELSVDSIAGGFAAPDTGAYPLLVALDSGDVDFDKALPDGSDLRVQYPDSSPLPFQIREWSRRDRAASLWVRIPRSDLWTWKKLRLLYGDGIERALQDPVATWKGVSASMREKIASTLLADFEQDTLRPLLPWQTTDWYLGWSAGAYFTRPAMTLRLEPALEYDSERRSMVVHATMNVPKDGWVLFGARLGTTIHRMAALDSIDFWAKGDGTIRIALEDGRDTSDLSKAWVAVSLDSVWRRYSVMPSRFDSADAWNVGWDDVRNRVTTISVFGMSGTRLWFDDLRLHGVSRWELR